MKSLISLFGICLSLSAAAWTENFDYTYIAPPEGIDPQVGGMSALPDGRIAIAFHRGEVMIYDPSTGSWVQFAGGLQEPLGLLAESKDSMLVMQRSELTRLKDNDGDGEADSYETVCDDFGMSGNYHEFAYGPAKDKEGNLFIVLGVASNGASMREEIRGEFSEIGELGREQMMNAADWKKNKDKAGRMYSRVKWRGWVLKITPDGSVQPYASGFRSPNGIGFDAKGRLLIADNQGDWRPTSPLYHIKEGGFYGHPASLVWKKDWNGRNPLDIDASEFDAMQEPAAGYFPQGELANSPTWPVVIPEGAFPGGMARQTLIGEMNQPTLVRVLDDEVDGVFQTGLVPMFDGPDLGIGNNRLLFGNDGALYVGKTALSWAGSKGLLRIKWNGKPFLALDAMKATRSGFDMTFSEAIDPASLAGLSVKRHTYKYHANYGSAKIDEQKVAVKAANLSRDGRTLHLDIGGLKEKYLHLVDMTSLRSKSGGEIQGHKVWYNVIKAPK
ncbi:hypothetical protein ACFSSA_06125 [Luteolibacter algae]|uniref:DUF7133 domain-containing protein n=1 Tax=Luteolibacter algae TaxID=454151 RepID=A0ABW5D5V7_9BACT